MIRWWDYSIYSVALLSRDTDVARSSAESELNSSWSQFLILVSWGLGEKKFHGMGSLSNDLSPTLVIYPHSLLLWPLLGYAFFCVEWKMLSLLNIRGRFQTSAVGMRRKTSRKRTAPIQSGTTFCGILMVEKPSAPSVIKFWASKVDALARWGVTWRWCTKWKLRLNPRMSTRTFTDLLVCQIRWWLWGRRRREGGW